MINIYLLWEIPLAFISFIFYKIIKFAIGNLYLIYLTFNQDKASQWRILSQKMLDSPLILPVLMTKAPRWNTHAIIGTLGPFKVEREIKIDIKSANNSAKSWIAVIYDFPNYKTITSIVSDRINSETEWHTIKLEPGKYSVGLRYYNRLPKITFPTIKIDEKKEIEKETVESDINQFYKNLINSKNWFYSSLHYYIFTILKWRNILPESFIRNEFLPVGAPDTFFAYNCLEKNRELNLEFTQEIVDNFEIYFTLYDRSSLPLTWEQIKTIKYKVEAQLNNGYYLLRVRPKSTSSIADFKINFEVLEENEKQQIAKIEILRSHKVQDDR